MTEKEYKELIYKKADDVENETQLLDLIKEIKEYPHDYGTIVYGCMAAMLAAFNVINKSPNGGITGFQASCLSWECVEKFTMKKPPLKLIAFEDMLFPQYENKFEKKISNDTWVFLQKEALKNLSEKNEHTSPRVIDHWRSIVSGVVPFGYSVEAVE